MTKDASLCGSDIHAGGDFEWKAAMMTLLLFVLPLYGHLLPGWSPYALLIIGIVLVVYSFFEKGGMSYGFSKLCLVAPWVVLCVYAGVSIALTTDSNITSFFSLVAGVLMMICLSIDTKWIKTAIVVLCVMLLPFAVVTITCYFFPILFSELIKPTFFLNNSDAFGYQSGLAGHYSDNGTYNAVGFLISLSMFIYSTGQMRKRGLYLLIAFVFFFALILTQKRGPLLFSIIAIVIVFLFSNSSNKIIKITGVVASTIVFLVFIAPMIPGVERSVLRLLDTFGNSNFAESTTGRTQLWNYAIEGWANSPLFGNGWSSYRFIWDDGVTVTLLAHNEFLNLLYEGGLVGLLLAGICVVFSFFATYRISRKISEAQYAQFLYMSITVQLYSILYAFTSGSLFFHSRYLFPYLLAVAICLAIGNKICLKENKAKSGLPVSEGGEEWLTNAR